MRLISIIFALLMATAASAGSSGFEFTPVALTGDNAFGSVTEQFRQFGRPTINQDGIVGFSGRASLTPSTLGLAGMYWWQAGMGALVARQDAPIPGLPGINLSNNFGSPVIDDAGRFAFMNHHGSNNSVLLVGTPQQHEVAAASGFAAPPGATFPGGLPSFSTPLQTRGGLLAFQAGPQSDRQIWVGPLGGLTLQYAPDTVVQDTPADSTASLTGFVRLDGEANTIASGRLVGGVHDNARILIENSSEGSRMIVGPGVSAGSYGTFTAASGPANINSNGLIGYTAHHQEVPNGPTRFAAWVGRPSAVSRLAVLGDQAPGLSPGSTFSDLNSPIITSAGSAVVVGQAFYPGSSNARVGIWRDDFQGDGLNLVLTRDDPVANTIPGSSLELVGTSDSSDVAVNALNQLAFLGLIKTPGQQFMEALIAADATGNMAALAVKGQPFLVAPNDFRTVDDIEIFSSGSSGSIYGMSGDDGQGSYLNDAGQLAFYLQFTDGSRGIFTTTIPCPSAALLLMSGMMYTRRRRNWRM